MAAAALGIGALSALPTSMQAAGAASPAAPAQRIGQAPHVTAGAANLGALPGPTTLHADVELSPRDPAGLASYATAISTPGNALYKHYITPSQFTSQFGPTAAAVSAVEEQLAASGLNVGSISANNLTLHVSGSASTFEKAFSTGFARYRLADQRIAYGNTAAPLIPGTIAGYVQGVIGLDDLTQPKAVGLEQATARSTTPSPHVVTGGPQPCASAVTDGTNFNAFTADQVASAYNLSSLYQANDEGAGVTVGLLELEPNSTSDIASFQSCYGTSAPVSYTEVDGGAGTGSGEGEAALDIEGIIDLAPKAAIDVFQAPNTFADLIDNYTSMVDDSTVNVISTSWGLCEQEESPTVVSSEGTLFQQSATEGQSVYAAAGDAGSSDCGDSGLEVDDPGSQPFVTSVGGTTLSSITGPVQSVWNDSFEGGFRGAGGGGISSLHAMAAYQSGAPAALNVVNANSSGTPCGAAAGSLCREVPDVSASADEDHGGYVVFFAGQWTAFGGTSAAAPTWAAFTALTNASSTCEGIGVGFANPALYDAAAANYSANFDDITSGNNDYTPDGNAFGLYPSGPAYDMASGLGTMNGAPLAAKLCGASAPVPPTVTKVSPSSGPVAGGTTVTITGTGFTGATGVKFGTNPATNVTVVSDTSITAVSPAGTAGVSDVTVSAPNGTSSPVATDHFTYTSGSRPAVTGVSPATGPTTGGTTVIITGVNFTGATKVTFASVAAPSFTVTAPSSITAVSPPGALGARNVQVTTPAGTSPVVASDDFTYTSAKPAITGVSPASGPATGGTTVAITGTGFTGATTVKFGTVAATSFNVVSNTRINAVSPAAPISTRNIQVTTAQGTSPAVAADDFTYTQPKPAVTGVSPASGPTVGGTTVTITGTSFDGTTKVTFASVAASSVIVVSNTKITAVSPPGAVGARNIQVTTPVGASPLVAADDFTYVVAKPAVTGISPTSGPKIGGTTVTITGTNFTGATKVMFGTVAATSFNVVSATIVTAVSPAAPASTRNIQVTTPAGTSPVVAADDFTYTAT